MDPFIYFNRKYLHIKKYTPGIFFYNESNIYNYYSKYDIYHLMIINFEDDVEKLYKLIQLLVKKKNTYSQIPIPIDELETIKKLNKKIHKLRNILDIKLLKIVKYFESLKKDNKCSIYNNSVCIGKYDNNKWKWDIKNKNIF